MPPRKTLARETTLSTSRKVRRAFDTEQRFETLQKNVLTARTVSKTTLTGNQTRSDCQVEGRRDFKSTNLGFEHGVRIAACSLSWSVHCEMIHLSVDLGRPRDTVGLSIRGLDKNLAMTWRCRGALVNTTSGPKKESP